MAKQRKKKRTPARPAGSDGRGVRATQAGHGVRATQADRGVRATQAGTAARQPASQATTKPTKPTRQERIQAAQRQRRRRQLVRRGIAVGAVLVVLGVITTVIVAKGRSSQRTIRDLEAGACEFDRRSDSDAGQGRNHVTGAPAYRVDPPAGGDHLASATPPGVYTESVPPDGQVVHAMEHGDVVLWHRPDLPAGVLSELRDIADKFDRDVLVVPRASLGTSVAATAWHKRLLCPTFERGPIELFVRSYRDQGPEKLDED